MLRAPSNCKLNSDIFSYTDVEARHQCNFIFICHEEFDNYLLVVLRLISLSAQSFYYVSTIDNSSIGESIIGYFDINSCKDTVLYTIQHEDFLGVEQFADIAVGTDGFLYLNTRPAPCKLYRYDIQNQIFQYIAAFPNTPLSFYISSLTCDANGVLFAAGAELFSYDIQSGLFTNHGDLPNNVTSAGDLTFYDGSYYFLRMILISLLQHFMKLIF